MWLVKAWMDAVKFNLEVQSVVAVRLMKIAAGGATGAAESTRMVQEKAEASVAALTAGSLALAKGRSVKAATSNGTGQEKGPRKSETALPQVTARHRAEAETFAGEPGG